MVAELGRPPGDEFPLSKRLLTGVGLRLERGRSELPWKSRRASTISGSMQARAASTPPPGARPIGAVVVLALLAALLLVVAELSTIAAVEVAGNSCEVINDSSPDLADRCSLSGWERHGGALLFLAVVAAAGGIAVRRGNDGPAGAVLLVNGAVALGIALIGDLPETNETGAIGLNFDGATAQAGLGFYLELTAGVLCLLAGLLVLIRARQAPAAASSGS